MNTLVELRIAYWREVITNTPCPEPLCEAKAGDSCAGSFDPVVHLARLRAWRIGPLTSGGRAPPAH